VTKLDLSNCNSWYQFCSRNKCASAYDGFCTWNPHPTDAILASSVTSLREADGAAVLCSRSMIG